MPKGSTQDTDKPLLWVSPAGRLEVNGKKLFALKEVKEAMAKMAKIPMFCKHSWIQINSLIYPEGKCRTLFRCRKCNKFEYTESESYINVRYPD